MSKKIGIRREDKNVWERRVPLTPEDVGGLIKDNDFEILLQPSEIRVFSDENYENAGARIDEDLSPCDVIFAVKEIPTDFFEPKKTYVFFSHVIKGQKKNMPMLKKMMDLECNLIDYEKVVNDKGKRLIFFGKHAGLAGMIDSLWALGQRLKWEKIKSPFCKIKKAVEYENLAAAKADIAAVGEEIKEKGIDKSIVPLVIGFAGYGNVSKGAQEIVDLLPTLKTEPEELASLFEESSELSKNLIYKVEFKEEHIVKPIDYDQEFQLQDYYDNPEKYEGQFSKYLQYFTILVNCIYWDARYPRLVTKDYLKKLYNDKQNPPRLRVLGDISCDIEGSIECNVKAATPAEPVYVYDTESGKTKDGCKGWGPVVLAVDNLPCELPKESSEHFSKMVKPYVEEIVRADYSSDFSNLALSPEIKRAVILYQGRLTDDYLYIKKFLHY